MYVNIETKAGVSSPGDSFEYDIFCTTNPTPSAGIDFDTDDANFRDAFRSIRHRLPPRRRSRGSRASGIAKDRPFEIRRETCPQFQARRGRRCPGLYVQFLFDNIFITHANGTPTPSLQRPAARNKIMMKEGYSQKYILKAVDRAKITDNVDAGVIDGEVKHFQLLAQLEGVRNEIELAHKVATAKDGMYLQQRR